MFETAEGLLRETGEKEIMKNEGNTNFFQAVLFKERAGIRPGLT